MIRKNNRFIFNKNIEKGKQKIKKLKEKIKYNDLVGEIINDLKPTARKISYTEFFDNYIKKYNQLNMKINFLNEALTKEQNKIKYIFFIPILKEKYNKIKEEIKYLESTILEIEIEKKEIREFFLDKKNSKYLNEVEYYNKTDIRKELNDILIYREEKDLYLENEIESYLFYEYDYYHDDSVIEEKETNRTENRIYKVEIK